MNRAQQAEQDFVDAMRVLYEVQESLRTKRTMTYPEYDRLVSARLYAWMALERWRSVRPKPVEGFAKRHSIDKWQQAYMQYSWN